MTLSSRTALWFSLLGVIGCGGAPEEAAQPAVQAAGQSDFDACALLTTEEIQASLAWVPDSTQKNSYGTTGNCTWFGPGGAMEQVSLLVGAGVPEMSSSATMAQWRAGQYANYGVTDAIVEPIEGLGVPAIRNEYGGLVAIEMAVRGQLVTVSSIATSDQVRALAGLVVGRMH